MSFRNRCRIAGSEGTIDLSIPLEKGRDQRALTRDVRIATGKWQSEHWKTILSCYSRSPWFEFYRDDLERLYRQPAVFLIDWDLACFEWVTGVLGLRMQVSFTDSWQKEYPEPEWVDWRNKIFPRRGDGRMFRTEGDRIDGVAGQTMVAPVVYRQVFEERTGFMPGLSILDLLFCEGQQASRILAGHTDQI